MTMTVRTAIAGVDKRVMLMDPGTDWSILALCDHAGVDLATLPPAVQVRVLYRDRTDTHLRPASDLRRLRDAGVELRTAPELPATVLVVDSVVFVATGTGSSGVSAVDNRPIADLVAALFDIWWRHPPDQAAPQGGELSSLELSVLRLLAGGHKDETAARMLNTSTRSLRRVVAALMDRLGSTTRFQAGVRSQQLGWIR